MKNMYPTPKMTARKRNEYAELPFVAAAFEPDDAARRVRVCRLRGVSGMAGSR